MGEVPPAAPMLRRTSLYFIVSAAGILPAIHALSSGVENVRFRNSLVTAKYVLGL